MWWRISHIAIRREKHIIQMWKTIRELTKDSPYPSFPRIPNKTKDTANIYTQAPKLIKKEKKILSLQWNTRSNSKPPSAQFHDNLSIASFRMNHCNIRLVEIPRCGTQTQVLAFFLLSNHSNISSWNNLYKHYTTVLEFSIAAPDFNEWCVKGKDVFSADDLDGFRFTMPIYDFGSRDFAMFVDVDGAF